MELYYCRIPNFGDRLNERVWKDFFPWPLDAVWPGKLFLGIGSLLRPGIPRDPEKVVFGAGCGYGSPPRLDQKWRVYCVRGPMTAASLGLSPATAVCDPAILLREGYSAKTKSGSCVAFMPHRLSAECFDLGRLCQRLGIEYIDPRAEVAAVIDQIRRADLLIAEAMHGAIVAHAFGVPWLPARSRRAINSFKWLDFCRSFDLPLRFVLIPPIWSSGWKRMMTPFTLPAFALQLGRLRRLVGRIGIRSDEARVGERIRQLYGCRDQMVADVESGQG